MPHNLDPRSDQQLIAAIHDGDWAAFDALYHRYRDWTFRLAWRFTDHESDAYDTVQEVFTYLAKKLSERLDLRAGMTTLLYPAVKHTALTLKRKRLRTHHLPDNFDLPAMPHGPDHAAPALRVELAHLLQSLSPQHREVLLMRFVDEMSLEEIAAALKIPIGTAKSRLHHALGAVRENQALCRRLEQ
ncbi:MAG TPA: sigma-70 family RNA polymerase sigma factor [Phycisphaerae bacterium]